MKIILQAIRNKEKIQQIIIIIISALSGVFTNLSAQNNQFKFEHITTDMGLSHGIVYGVLQDSRGFMWFGTQDGGLNRYDGYSFVVFEHDPTNPKSLSNNNPGVIYEDKSGALWVGTWGGGVNQYFRDTGEFVHFKNIPGNKNSLSSNRVQSLFEDRHETLWVGTFDVGLNSIDKSRKIIRHFKHDASNPNSISHNRIWAMLEDSLDNLWVGTTNGLDKFNPSREKVLSYKHNPNDPESISDSQARCLLIDKAGYLWVGTGEGLNKLQDDKFSCYLPYADEPEDTRNNINTLFQDEMGRIWVGTEGGGLCVFNEQTKSFRIFLNDPANPESLTHNDVRFISQDKSGILWITTRGGGVDKLNLNPKKFKHYNHQSFHKSSLSNNHVRTIYKDKTNIIWIGTDTGLDRFDRRTGRFSDYSSKIFGKTNSFYNSVNAITENSHERMWIGTHEGLFGFNNKPGEFKRFVHYEFSENDRASLSNNLVWTLFVDHTDALWIGTYKGLSKLTTDNKFINYYSDKNNVNTLTDNSIRTIIETSTGTLWVGTDSGLNKFDRETETFKRYFYDPNIPNSIGNDRIYSLCETKKILNGTLWIGTQRGLTRMDVDSNGAESFTVFTKNNGLPNNVILGILEGDDGNLWLSTLKGISRFNPISNEFRNYNTSNGLQGNEFNIGASFVGKDNELFFGGTNGFNSFYPSKVQDNKHIPPIVITDFKVSGRHISLNKSITEIEEIRLTYKDNSISFEFAALDYNSPEENMYSYILEGSDGNWIDAKNRRYASYSNLDPGEYIFKVKGSNNDGFWNETGTSVKIIINPPFWRTWWFTTFIVLLIVFIIIIVIQNRIKNFENQKKLLEKQIEMSNRSDRLKTEFLAQMSHEIRTPINAILSFVTLIKERFAETNSGSIDDLLNPIDSSGRRVVRTIDLILNMSEIQTGTFEPIIKTFNLHRDILTNMIKEFNTAADSRHLTLKYECIVDNSDVLIDDYSVRQIFSNLIENAIKYTKKGEVSVVVFHDKNEKVCVSVQDTGIGIAKEFIPDLFKAFTQEEAGYTRRFEGNGLGLALVKKYCEMNNAEISVESEKGKGTCFTVIFNTKHKS
ncbi:MAG: hypothetical protein KKA84_15375 [Bacteroidetes bacterium]|nr:hypothetical protein [Bacteroidota bacterium]